MPRRDSDLLAELKALLSAKMQRSDYPAAERMLDELCAQMGADDDNPESPRPAGSPMPGGAQDRKYAMDSADAFTKLRDLQEAQREVAPIVGEILGMDSAATVFREALSRLGVDHRGLPDAALPAMFRTARRGQHGNGGAPRIAQDSRGAASFAARFPDAARVRNV